MIYISDSAKSRVLEIKKDEKLGAEFFVRIGVVGGGCSGLVYTLDFDNTLQEADLVFEDKGVRMVTDASSFLYLQKATLDFSGETNGRGFCFINPNVHHTCSCGDSFAVQAVKNS